MKAPSLLFIMVVSFVLVLWNIKAPAQGTWTCVQNCDSNQSLYETGRYGTRGVAAANVYPPQRYYGNTWVDTAGNFWLMGGCGIDEIPTTALFKFDPDIEQWTWMWGHSFWYTDSFHHVGLGVYDSSNALGSLRGAGYTWVTPNNHLWIYAASSYTFTTNQPMGSDLWQYDPAINQWAWMGQFAIAPTNLGIYPADTANTIVYGTRGTGSAQTTPGHRGFQQFETGAAWTDAQGNLWLFGGRTYYVTPPGSHVAGHIVQDSGYLADMWKYDISTGIWTWMSGSNMLDDAGHYGTLGVPSVNNYPAARTVQNFWKDDNGIFWLAGGLGIGPDTIQYSNAYQDVWKFNPATLEWTWVKGPSAPSSAPHSGAICDTSSSNIWGRHLLNHFVWKVNDDVVITYESKDTSRYLDLWTYDFPTNNLIAYAAQPNAWVPIAEYPLAVNYGVTGVPSPNNLPTPRCGAFGFVDKRGTCWLWGGQPSANINWSIGYSDLWKYNPDTSCLRSFSSQLILSTAQVSKPLQFDIAPNPTTGSIKITLQQTTGTGGMIDVLNTLGQIVYSTELGTGVAEKYIQLPAVNSGIYFVRLTIDKQQTTQKLVIVH